MIDIDSRQIAPRCGGQREAFEEICCQLARRTVPEDATFTRLHGAGGKSGTSQKRFYKGLIKKADARFDSHLAILKAKKSKKGEKK